jgi:hypothetical protein
MKFFYCQDNGVVALTSVDTLNDMAKYIAIIENIKDVQLKNDSKALYDSLAHLNQGVIFTFSRDRERFKKSPWFTGDIDLFASIRRHFRNSEHTFEERSFFVPFSNGCELGFHGESAMATEFRFVTTEQQFREAFGISRSELLAK